MTSAPRAPDSPVVRSEPPHHRRGFLLSAAWGAFLAGLVIFQVWMLLTRLPLSLGPRVILQPWLVQDGRVMYEDMVDIHSPLMPMALALFRWIVPDGLALARLALVALFGAGMAVAAVTARKLAGAGAGVCAAVLMAYWSTNFGFAKLWHESFLAFVYIFWIAWLVFFWDRKAWWRLPAFGLIGGIAILLKQHALVVFAAFLIWYLVVRRRESATARRVLGELGQLLFWAAVPGLVFLAAQFARAGTLSGFFYWAILYHFTSDYVDLAMRSPGAEELIRLAIIFSGLPFAAGCLWAAWRKNTGEVKYILLLLMWMGAGLLLQYPRFAVFHFQPLLPMLAVVYAWAGAFLIRHAGRFRVTMAAGVIAVLIFWFLQTGLMYRESVGGTAAPSVEEYSSLVPAADRLRPYVRAGASVFIFPDDESLSNLYYLLEAKPPDRWIFHYPWYMTEAVQERILNMFRDHAPDYVIYPGPAWGVESNSVRILAVLGGQYREVETVPWEGGELRLLERRP